MNLFIYEQTTSTNDLGRRPTFRHSDVIWAISQIAGRGQRGNKWQGGEGENITFTVVLEPKFLAAQDQFLISQITALALCSAMNKYGIEPRIKWTNDIYVGERKLSGILIENSLSDGVVGRSIIGIGLNINQRQFDPSLLNPTSMVCEADGRYSCEEVLREVWSELMMWYERLRLGERELIVSSYHKLLYRRGECHTYRLPSGERFEGVIEGVAQHGELCVRHGDGVVREYLFRDIEFVIEARGR